MAAARGAIQDTRPAGDPRQGPPAVSDEDVDRDDPDADDHTLGGAQLLERELGASIIEEIPTTDRATTRQRTARDAAMSQDQNPFGEGGFDMNALPAGAADAGADDRPRSRSSRRPTVDGTVGAAWSR